MENFDGIVDPPVDLRSDDCAYGSCADCDGYFDGENAAKCSCDCHHK